MFKLLFALTVILASSSTAFAQELAFAVPKPVENMTTMPHLQKVQTFCNRINAPCADGQKCCTIGSQGWCCDKDKSCGDAGECD